MKPRQCLLPLWLEAASVHVVALLSAVMGVINLLSAVTPATRARLALLERYSPLAVTRGGHLAAALSGFALLTLSLGLGRRKRVAWVLTVVVLLASAVVHLIKGLDYEEALLSGALATWLIYLRPHFHARSDVPSIRQGLQTLLVAFFFTLAYGVSGFYLLDRHFRVHFGIWDALRQTIVMFTEFYDPGLEPISGFGRYFADSIYIVSAVTFGYALLMLIRPVLVRHRTGPDKVARAAEIVRAYGRTSLARLTLLNDKLYFFSPGGSVIAYALQGRVALALGDPIGPVEDTGPCILSFKELCALNDWQPAFYQVLPDYLGHYTGAGFNALCIGHEGLVDVANFTLEGSHIKNVRNAYNKLVRLGYTAEVVEPPHSPQLLGELRAISDEWLTHVGGSEMRFSFGWFDDEYLNTCPILLVRDPQGRIEAFANLILVPQAGEVAIDLMRHRRQSESGRMEFLFVSLILWAKQKGLARFNMGLSALSGVGENPEDPAIERALRYIYEHLNRFYNFKGLHAFKEKFQPTWSPRYLIYPGPTSLPAVALALLRADTGGDLLGGYLRHPG